MPRQPLWKTDKTRKKCELSSCNNTAEKRFGTCFMHRMIAFNESRGYDFSWVTRKQSDEASQNALEETNRQYK